MSTTDTDGTVRAELRAAMDEVAATPPLPPAWPRLERGLKRVRRRRRAARAGKVAGGLVLVGAALAAIQTNTVPYPSWATVTIPATGGASRLSDGPVRGSLAGDTAFLDALRRHVAAGGTAHESGGEAWSPPSASAVQVLFAGDVGPVRATLVEGDWHWGLIASRQQVWFVGPRGTAAAGLEQGGNDAPQDTATFVYEPQTWIGRDGENAEGRAAVVVLSARPVAAQLRQPPRYSADGSVENVVTPLPEVSDGVYQAVVTGRGTYQLIVPGRGWEQMFSAWRQPEAADVPLAGFVPPVRGGVTPAGDEQAAEALFTTIAADQPVQGTSRRLVWAGDVDGDRYRVAALTTTSGARVVAVLRHEFSGENLSTVVVAGAVLPAGPAGGLAVAWRLPATTDIFAPRPGPTVAAVGPADATRAVFLDADRKPLLTVTLQDGFASANLPAAAAVRFEDARGTDLGILPVRAPLADTQHVYDR